MKQMQMTSLLLLGVVVIVTIVQCILALRAETTNTKSFTLSPNDESRFIEIETTGRFTPTRDKNHMVVKSLTHFGVSPLVKGVIWSSIAPVTDSASPVIDASMRTFKLFNTRIYEKRYSKLSKGTKGVDQRTMAVSLPAKEGRSLFLVRNEPVKVSYHIELLLATYDDDDDNVHEHISDGVYLGFSTGGGNNIIRVVRPSFLLSGATIFSGTFDFVPDVCDISYTHKCVVVDPVLSVQAGNAPTAVVAVTILRAELKLENE